MGGEQEKKKNHTAEKKNYYKYNQWLSDSFKGWSKKLS